METYTSPEFEVIEFTAEDVITSSNCPRDRDTEILPP